MAYFESLESSLSLSAGDFIKSAKRAASASDDLGDEASGAGAQVAGLGTSLTGAASAAATATPPINSAARAIDDAGDEATATSGIFGWLSITTDGLTASMTLLVPSLYGVAGGLGAIMLALAPLLPVVVTAVGALGALAAIFGVIVGSGIAAWMQKTGTTMKEVFKSISNLVTAFGQQFIPLIKDAIALIPSFLSKIGKAVGSLKPFVHALRVLGSIAYRVIPPLVGLFADLARSVLPFVLSASRWIAARLVPALQALFNAGQRAAGEVYRLAKALFRAGKSLAGVAGWVGRFATALYDLAAAALGVGKLTRELKRVGQVIKTGLTSAFRWLSTAGVKLAQRAFRAIANAAVRAFRIGKQLLPAVKRGVRTAWRWVRTKGVQLARQALRLLGQKAVAAFQFGKTQLLPAIRRGMRAAWRWVRTKGVALARQALRTLGGFVRQIWRRIWTRLPRPVRRAIRRVQQTLTGLSKRFRAEFALIQRVITRFVATATRKLRQFGRLVKQAIRNPTRAFQRLKREIRSLLPSFSKLKTTAASLAARIRSQLLPVLGGAGLVGVASTLAFIFRGPFMMALSGIATYLSGPLSKAFAGAVRASGKLKWALGLLAGDVRKFGRYLRGVITRALGPLATILGRLRGYLVRFAGVLSGPVLSALSFVLSPVKRLGLLLAGPLIAALSSVGSAIVTLLPTIGTLGSTIALLANPITLIVGLIAGLALAWKTNLWNMRKIAKQIFSAIKALISGNMNLAKKRFSKAVGMINASWSKNIKPLIQSAKQIFNTIKRVVSDAMQWLITNAVKPVLRSLHQLWQRHGQNIMESVKELFNFLKGIFKVALGALILAWRHFGDEILTVTKFIFDAVGSTIKAVLDTILTVFDAVTDFMAGEWKQGLNKLWGLAKRIFNGIIDFIVKWGSGFVKWIIDILADALDAFIDWGHDLIFGSVIPNILNAIIKEIKSWSLVSAILGVLSTALDTFVQWGKDILGTVKSAFGDVVNYIRTDLWSDMTSALGNLANAAWSAFESAFNALMPDSIPIPSVTVGGYDMPGPIPDVPSKTIGGGSIPLPSLGVGGRVTETGLALVHEGETVVPASANKPYHGPDEQALARAVAHAVVEGFSRVEIKGGDVYLDGEELTDSVLSNLETRANRHAARQTGGGR